MVAFVRQCQYNSDMASDRMQLHNMCKKGHEIFQRIRPKVERPSSPGGTPNIEKGDDNRDSRHITSVLLWKDGGLHTFNFADLVFADERIKVGLKRGKFNHPAWTNEKIGANEEGENEGETHAVTAVPIWKLPHQLNKHHYSANISPSHYPSPCHPQRPSLNQP